MSAFLRMLEDKWDEGKFVCVGLDSDMSHEDFPKEVPLHPWITQNGGFGLNERQKKQLSFNCFIIDATKDLACAYKPNLAFYPYDEGKKVLQLTFAYIIPHVPVILDGKQGDIGNTNNGYLVDNFDFYGADAVTINPYLGMEANQPFLDRTDRGIILLCKTSNPSSGEFQDRMVMPSQEEAKRWGLAAVQDNLLPEMLPLYQLVAHQISERWNVHGNCALVVGATHPEQLATVRQIVGDMPILIPGIGAQGGDLEATVTAGKDSRGQGMIINSSRGIIFASSGEDFAEAARAATLELHEAINHCLREV